MKRYPQEIHNFIEANVKGRRIKALVDMVNSKFDTDFNYSKMRSYMKNHGLKNEMPKGLMPGEHPGLYSDEVKRFITDNYKGKGHQVMADLLNNTFDTNYTKSQIKSYYARYKLDSGLKGYFSKGHVPVNKGTKGMFNVGGNKTSFKKGQMPHNWVPVGSERITKDGYIQIKIQEGKQQHNWRGKHILIWEKHNGPLPKGNAIIFGDGNNRNFDINNLLLVSRSQLLALNRYGLIKNDIDLTQTGIVIADVLHEITKAKRRG